jgi:hypothetical protein
MRTRTPLTPPKGKEGKMDPNDVTTWTLERVDLEINKLTFHLKLWKKLRKRMASNQEIAKELKK